MHLFKFSLSSYSSLKRVIKVIRDQLMEDFVVRNLGLNSVERGNSFSLKLK
jgi:hypothetical protein